MRCHNCNYPVLPKFDKCPKCGEPLKNNNVAPAPHPVASNFDSDSQREPSHQQSFDFDAPAQPQEQNNENGLSVINGKVIWSLSPGEIARRITPKEIADCKAARGVVVQDGVTAAIFVDGVLAKVMDGGVYRFGNETVIVNNKPQVVTRHNEVVKPAPQNKIESPEDKKDKNDDNNHRSFFQKLLNAIKPAKKEISSIKPEEKAKLEAKKKKEEEKRRQVAEEARKKLREQNEARQPVVTIYLMSDRIFEISFGKDNGVNYAPFMIHAGIHEVEVGVRMQMCVSDFDIFRRNYLLDSNRVTVSSLQKLMTPWVLDILTHAFSKTDLSKGLDPSASQHVSDLLINMLQSRIFGISIVNVFDLITSGHDFEEVRKRENELWQAEQEALQQNRLNEFRNRVAVMETETEVEFQKIANKRGLDEKEAEIEYRKKLYDLNKDELLSEDQFDKFMELHQMEIRLRKASQEADEQTRRYEADKLLAELEQKKLLDKDEFDIVKEEVENRRFEREQLNDILRQRALQKNTLEKLKLENETALTQKSADHAVALQDNQFRLEDLDFEQQLYGKQYAIEKQKAADALEQESLALDAQIIRMRKEDEYADERYKINKGREHDDWEEEFLRESKTFDRSLDQQKKQSDFDFDQKVRNTNFEFDFETRKAERDFDINSRQAAFDFDMEQKRAEADTERSIRLDSHAQDMADRIHQRTLEEKHLEQEALRLKGNFAMENMKAMMEAKRAQRQDELQADIDKLNIRSQMTAEQIASEQLAALDAEAQKAYMEAVKEKNSSTHENEALKREMEARKELQEQSRNDMKEMMARMMEMTQQSNQQFADLAKTSINANADIAKARAEAETGATNRRAEELERDNARYREDAIHAQTRLDDTQKESLRYSTQQTITSLQSDTKPIEEEKPDTVKLNTAWLRSHKYQGSFNELAGLLNSMGAHIGQEFDENGNPVIVVDGLTNGQVIKVLQDSGVEF